MKSIYIYTYKPYSDFQVESCFSLIHFQLLGVNDNDDFGVWCLCFEALILDDWPWLVFSWIVLPWFWFDDVSTASDIWILDATPNWPEDAHCGHSGQCGGHDPVGWVCTYQKISQMAGGAKVDGKKLYNMKYDVSLMMILWTKLRGGLEVYCGYWPGIAYIHLHLDINGGLEEVELMNASS